MKEHTDLLNKYLSESTRENFLFNELKKLKQHIEVSKTDRELFLENEVRNK